MGTLVNIKVPDIFIDVPDGFSPGLVLWLEPLGLHLTPEAFHRGVVPAVPLSAHTTHKTIRLQHFLVFSTAVRGSSVRM